MTLTIKDSLELTGTSKPGLSSKSSDNPQGQSSRSDPVCLEVPVIVRSLPGEAGNTPGFAGPTRQEGRSVIVFDNGGVLRLANSLPVGQKVILTNPQGRDVVGRVVGGRNLPSIKGYIEVEFIEPVSDFWQIHKASEANQVSTPSLMDLSDEAALLPSPSQHRVAPPVPPIPIAPVKEQPVAAGSAPTFEDIAGLLDMPPAPVAQTKKNEPAVRPSMAQSKDAPPPSPVHPPKISPSNISVSSISESISEKPADAPAPATFSAMSRNLSSSNEPIGKVATFSGMSSLPTPDESSGRMPLILGGAVLILAAIGGGYFLLHKSSSPAASVPAAVAVSQPAAPPAELNSAPVTTPTSEPAIAQTSQQTSTQSSQQTAQPVSVAAPAEVAAPAPSVSQNSRQRANPPEPKQNDRAAARPPQVTNLKMSSPKAPGKNLPGATDGSSAPSVDMAMTAAPGVATPGTFGARTDHQPTPPAEAPAEISTPRPGKNVQSAKLISSTPPVYPTLAKQSNTQGRVTIDVSIDATGSVVSAKAVSGPIPLRQSAVDAVKRWKYSPAQIDGKPSSSETTIEVEFRLK